jgi:hypothetical protein
MTAQRWLSAAWAWTQIEAGLVARNSLNGAAIGSSWIAAKSRAGALSLQDELVHLASWTNKKAGHLSRASLATASLGFSWAKPNGQPASANHRALVTRRCTALISFEPRRARLPAIRLSATRAVSSDADRASP